MEIVNSHPSTKGDMNSCVVSCFPSHKATLSLHSDNEKIISQCSSICTVSFGAPRELQFVVAPNGKRDLAADLVLPVTSEVTSNEKKLAHDVTAPAKPKKNVVLVAGDSFAARMKSDLLGKGKKDVRNIAKGGRKIDQVRKDISDFIKSNPELNVLKIFVSVGANDIRNCENSIIHLKDSIKNLMRTIKDVLPNAKIWFQSILHIHPNGSDIYPETP